MGEGFRISIKIDDGFMSLEIDGMVIATARERTGLSMRRRGEHTPGCRACYSSFSGI